MSRLYPAPESASLLGMELDTLYDNRSKLLPEVLRDAARQPKQQSHLRCGSRRLSWAEIDLLSDRFAAALLERGVGVGDRVVIVLPNSVEFVIACFAIWKARAIAVPEDISIRPVSLQFILEQTQPTAFLLDGRLAEQLQRMPQALGSVRTLFLKDCAGAPSGLAGIAIESLDAVLQSEAPARVLPTGARVDDVVSINYTSGSTGMPKGVMHTHESWLAGAAFTRDYVGVSANDVMVIPLPLHHTYAFRQMLAYLLAKGSVVIAADIYSALNLIPEQRPTALLLVPAACNILIDHFASVLREVDGILRYIEIGSGAMTLERLNCLRELLPQTLIHLPYGLTEGRVGYLKPGPDGLVNRLKSCSPGLQVQVVDSQGQPVAREQTGEIVLKGQGLMKGYFGEPEAAQERLRSQGFRTRDMGRVDASGEIALLGRLDDILKIAGHKINPLEVEATLNHHPAVAESAVLGLPDPRGILELELHAFVVLRKSTAPTSSELLAHCRQYLEPYKVPNGIHFCTSFPKSSLGKIQRQLLFAEQAPKFTPPKGDRYASTD